MLVMKDKTVVRNALISCHDKTGLKYFAAELVKLNPDVRIYCSSGTFNDLKKVAPGNAVEISDYTGAKEMPSGLVKTLHPRIHAGILADLDDEQQRKYLESIKAVAFDLVVVNLYPFFEAAKGKSIENARQNIDIGGVSLIEAASKNFLRVAVLVSPAQYETFLDALRNRENSIKLRLKLAQSAMDYLREYIEHISSYFNGLTNDRLKEEYKVD